MVYELIASGEQTRQMRQFAGACRFVYNKALALQQSSYQAGEKFIRYESMAKMLTVWRNGSETPWLKDAPVHPLQHALKDLEKAYKSFFASRVVKRKSDSESFRYPDSKQIKLDAGNARIFMPKLGWLRLRLSRPVLGDIRNVTVSQRSGKWFVSIQTQREVEAPVPAASSAVGIDAGVVRFATLSDGNFIAPLASFKRHQTRLARYQRRMARKVKGSCNWKKAKRKVRRIHTEIAYCRADFLHKTSTLLSRIHALVVLEDLGLTTPRPEGRGFCPR